MDDDAADLDDLATTQLAEAGVADYRERTLALLEDRNRLIREQTTRVEEVAAALREEIQALRADLNRRPTREEVAAQRRRAVIRSVASVLAAVFVACYLAIYFHETYRDECEFGPVVRGQDRPAWCGYVFPGADGARTMNPDPPTTTLLLGDHHG